METSNSRAVYYQCTECGERDSDRGIYDPPPAAIICWNCRAGSKMSIHDQVLREIGMIPIKTD